LRSTLRRLALACLVSLPVASPAEGQGRGSVYFPGPGDDWQRRAAARAGMDSARLAEAVRFAVGQRVEGSARLELAHYQTLGREPFGEGQVLPLPAARRPTGDRPLGSSWGVGRIRTAWT
jgi:hypothetical protein